MKAEPGGQLQTEGEEVQSCSGVTFKVISLFPNNQEDVLRGCVKLPLGTELFNHSFTK